MKHERERLPLRERNRQQILQRIVAAAFELFSTAGYDQTTMDAIAEKAQISRGTLFNYFPTKDALLMPFAKELYQQHIQPEVMAYLDTQPTTLQALRFLLMSIHDQILTLPDMDRALQQEFLHAHSPKKVSRHSTGFLESIVAILHYGQQRGEVRTDIPLEKLARYVGVLCVSLFYGLFEPGSPTQYAVEVDNLLTFMSTALR